MDTIHENENENKSNLLDVTIKKINNPSPNQIPHTDDSNKNINIIDFNDEQLLIINTYMEYYNNKSGNNFHMFKDTKYTDPTSINHIMSEFYDIMCLYNTNKINNPQINKIYKEGDFFEKCNYDQLFCLKYNKKSYYSSSLMSLIKLVAKNKIKNWIIHTLK
jgi:hypothetical protein